MKKIDIPSCEILDSSFYARDTVQVAQDLLGKKLVRVLNGQYLIGIIAETEAYTSDDPASHAYRGKSLRNSSLFGPVGHAYVYLSYGLHYCLNLVAHTEPRTAGGVLIRSIIPVRGVELMLKARKSPLAQLANGPGKVAQAMYINKSFDGIDITDKNGPLYVTQGLPIKLSDSDSTPRIGISKAIDVPWRFIINHRKSEELKALIEI